MNKILLTIIVLYSLINVSCIKEKSNKNDERITWLQNSDSVFIKDDKRLKLSILEDTVTQELYDYTNKKVLHKLVYNKTNNIIYLDSGEYTEVLIDKKANNVYHFIVTSTKLPTLGKVISLIGRKLSKNEMIGVVLESIESDTTINRIKYKFTDTNFEEFDDFIICTSFLDKASIENKKNDVSKQTCTELGPFWGLKR